MGQSKIRSILKIIIYTIAVVGVVLMYGNIQGWFQQKDRLNLYNQLIKDPYRLESNFPGVKDFLEEFFDPSKANQELKSIPIKGIKLTWITVGGSNKPMAGNVHLWLEGDKRSTSIATLDDFADWAKETPFYDWLSLILVTVGVVGTIIMDVYPRAKNSLVGKHNPD